MGLFRRRVVTYFMSMPVIALVNNVLKLGLNEVKLRFRARLSEHLYKKYMQGERCAFRLWRLLVVSHGSTRVGRSVGRTEQTFCSALDNLFRQFQVSPSTKWATWTIESPIRTNFWRKTWRSFVTPFLIFTQTYRNQSWTLPFTFTNSPGPSDSRGLLSCWGKQLGCHVDYEM